MTTTKRTLHLLRQRLALVRQSLGVGGREISREWYLVRMGLRLGIGVALIGAWIHGIYWAGGLPGTHAFIMQANNPNPTVSPPIGFLLIDFAPLTLGMLVVGGLIGYELFSWLATSLFEKWQSLPSYEERRKRIEKHRVVALHRRIAELELEYDNLGQYIELLRNSNPNDSWLFEAGAKAPIGSRIDDYNNYSLQQLFDHVVKLGVKQ